MSTHHPKRKETSRPVCVCNKRQKTCPSDDNMMDVEVTIDNNLITVQQGLHAHLEATEKSQKHMNDARMDDKDDLFSVWTLRC